MLREGCLVCIVVGCCGEEEEGRDCALRWVLEGMDTCVTSFQSPTYSESRAGGERSSAAVGTPGPSGLALSVATPQTGGAA